MTSLATPPASAQTPEAPAWRRDPRERDITQEERDYLFDLRGFQIIEGALSSDELAQINDWIDAQDIDALQPGDWLGDVQVHTYGAKDGINFQNIIEGGPIFEHCIDHPSWFEQAKRYIQHEAHLISIDENFLNIRRRGGFIPVHSGGAHVRFTSNFRNHAGRWAVGQINVLMALNDIGLGDGCTTIVPSSHKSHMDHPCQSGEEGAWERQVSGNDAVAMVQVHLKAGDALMFTDALTHASLPRTNGGERRVMIYRYAPHLLAKRYNYLPSRELMARLTDRQRKLVQPTPQRFRPGRVITSDEFTYDPIGQ